MATAEGEKRNTELGMDLLWGTQERPSRGPKPMLSLGEIARAGIRIADAEGLGALSMRRIAEELGFTTMSLYRHVPGKTELLAVMIDTAIGDALPLTESDGSWRARLEHWAYQNLELLLRHPWMLVIDSPDSQTGPNKMAWIEAGLQTIADTGLDGGEMLEIIFSAYVYVHGSAQVFSLWEREEAPSWTTRSPLMQRVARNDRFPILNTILASGALDKADEEEPDESFAFGLQRMLDGIEAYINARSSRVAVSQAASD
jgi:AcrR family transcriptional regulator